MAINFESNLHYLNNLRRCIRLARPALLLVMVGVVSSCNNNVRATLKGGYPLCYGQKEDLDLFVEIIITDYEHSGIKYPSLCAITEPGGRFSLVEDHGRVVRIKPRWANLKKDPWTYRENVYDEPPEKILSLIRSILEKRKGSRRGFVHPKTGQLDDCAPMRPLLRGSKYADMTKPPAPDLGCEKELRANGLVRADEYQIELHKRGQ